MNGSAIGSPSEITSKQTHKYTKLVHTLTTEHTLPMVLIQLTENRTNYNTIKNTMNTFVHKIVIHFIIAFTYKGSFFFVLRIM